MRLSRLLLTFVLTIVVGGIAVGACLAALIPGTVEVATAHHYSTNGVAELSALAEPSTVYWNDGVTELGTLGTQFRDPVSLDQVPKNLINAVIATEDRTFWTNDGIDLGAVFRAFLKNVTSGQIEQGGSTITQQLVKNRLLTSKRTVNRKVKEIEDAIRLNDKFSKKKILEEYLNTIYLGSGSYGVKSAAERYFGKPLDQLSNGEAALLAGLISNPEGNNPFNHFDRAVRRRADVLRGEVEAGYLTQVEADAANNEPMPTVVPPAEQRPTNFLVAEVQDRLLADPRMGSTLKERTDKLLKGGLKITTSFDQKLQALAQDATNNAKPPIGPDWIASLVAIDPTSGAVKAMVGGPDFTGSQFNIATSANGRQTGSTFKVITLAAALANGYSPNDMVDGSDPCPVPSQFPNVPPDQFPTNSDGREGGPQSIASATANSVNCAFVRIATSVGYDKVIDMAHKLGITKNNLGPPAVLNETLGTKEQNTLTMATVMATIANRGVHHTPYVVAKVVAAGGKVILDDTNNAGDDVLATDVADCEQNVLRGVVTGGTGGNANVGGQEIFGKTGTTDNTTDAWFIGANPGGNGMQLATAVWFGNRTGAIEGAGFGGDSAAPVFQAFMSAALDGQPEAALPAPGLVCARPGQFVNPDGGRAATPPDLSSLFPPTVQQAPTVRPQTTTPISRPPVTTPVTSPPITAPPPTVKKGK
jgi:penicillin-binding protein 1A